MKTFFETASVPVHCNVLWPDPQAALAAPRGDVSLGYCRQCGAIYNRLFDGRLTTYSATYENSLYFSPAFREYARSLVDHLIATFMLQDADIVEIGSGAGDFLAALCEESSSRGIGFDPSAPVGRHPAVTVVPEFYGPEQGELPADLVLARHVLEHVPDPRKFLSDVRAAMRPTTGVFFEVPNALFILRDLSVWDVIYEHFSYFSHVSLTNLFRTTGFEVTDVYPSFGDQFLCVEAKGGDLTAEHGWEQPDEAFNHLVEQFGEAHRRTVTEWSRRIARWEGEGLKIALWGAGSKGVTFLNSVEGGDRLGPVVDINPRKQGKFVPGTGQPVIDPPALAAETPDVVLVMNPLYREEIVETLNELRIRASVEVI